ncbi:peptidoglycan-binding protein [Lentzea sp. CC55]|uniref:peptidoglycan-binding domain-containing protein n=1 Tax=Lentzea sp. CC55 TaxID=2884909 RepID=UPI001F2673CA|nr:peptidoglycan-binding domain-containing protein [Lentzea sp. CC55]MCG8925197.1 peptidoglycan-binding protein [Lentzea sp. CC55]
MRRNGVIPAFLGAALVAALTLATPASAAQDPRSGGVTALADCPRVSNSYDIGPGATGGNVLEVQCLLNRTLSWNAFPFVIKRDGEYGPITAAAVWEFQECVNARGTAIGVDGRVGPETLPHLRWWGNVHSPATGERIC